MPSTRPRSVIDPDERMIEVAHLYWREHAKIDDIARRLHLSRSTVSRILSDARDRGVVTFEINDPSAPRRLEQAFTERFGVRASIVRTDPGTGAGVRLDLVARAAVPALTEQLTSEMTLTVAWGTTIDAVSRRLVPEPITALRIVQYNGSGNLLTTGVDYSIQILERFADAYAGTIHLLPFPAFFDSVVARRAVWEERSVKRVLHMRNHANALITSIGTLTSSHPGHLYRAGYLNHREAGELHREGVVGDLGGRFFRADGSSDGIAYNDRATGMTFTELRGIPTRLVVIADPSKASALHAVLRAGLATHLVIDDLSAERTLALGSAR